MDAVKNQVQNHSQQYDAHNETISGPLSPEELRRLNAYWRAANYLSVGQIYLMDNPLLKEPLKLEHIKPRLLGHWGTTPGLNFIYAHLNRVIKINGLNVIYITGPGHGGPGLVANTYLEGTYSEVYPNISQDEEGMQHLFKQFSFPGGIPSHVELRILFRGYAYHPYFGEGPDPAEMHQKMAATMDATIGEIRAIQKAA